MYYLNAPGSAEPPVFMDYKNMVDAQYSPGTVHARDTALVAYFRRYYLQKAMSVFKWKLPDWWQENYFLYTLYTWGFICALNTNKFGVIPQGCSLGEYTVQYTPRTALVTNPLFGSKTYELVIDRDCVVFHLMPDYGGIMDIINYFAEMSALASETASVNLLNSKVSYVFAAANKQGAEAFKKMYDMIASGQPCVVYDKSLQNADGSPAWTPFIQNVGSNYIITDILADQRTLEERFDTLVGLPSANTQKRERLNQDEVNSNNVETAALGELWLDGLKKQCARARDLLGIDIDVDWRYHPMNGGEDNESDA